MTVVDKFRVTTNGSIGVNPTVDAITSIALVDGPIIEWDVTKSKNAFVRLDHNISNRLFTLPHNIKVGEKYTLTLIQDKNGGASITFDPAINILSNINTESSYKTTIVLYCEGNSNDMKLNSKMVSYSIDKNQII
jgi:hypothetical protein